MVTTPESAQMIQALLAIPFLLMGASHIVQPKMWIDFFVYLHGLGTTGVLIRTFALELVPAFAIVTFHFVWSGPAAILSLYGVLLTLKVAISLFIPSLGLKSLSLADQKGNVSFVVAGAMLIALSAVCFWCLLR